MPPLRNIILIGHRKSGKTSIGLELSSLLNILFFDTDKIIEKIYFQLNIRKKVMTAAEIYQKEGCSYFRKLEGKAIYFLKEKNSQKSVIAIGGGTLDSKKNQETLQSIGDFYHLKIPFNTFLNRNNLSPPIYLDDNKNTMSQLKNIYKSRSSIFSSLINHGEFDTNGKNINQIAQEIANGIK